METSTNGFTDDEFAILKAISFFVRAKPEERISSQHLALLRAAYNASIRVDEIECSRAHPLSRLESLPLELLNHICSHVTIADTVRIFNTSHMLRKAVYTLSNIQGISNSPSLAATFAVMFYNSPRFRDGTFSDFVNLVTSFTCTHCADPSTFATNISWFTLERVCWICAATVQKLFPVPPVFASTLLVGISHDEIRDLKVELGADIIVRKRGSRPRTTTAYSLGKVMERALGMLGKDIEEQGYARKTINQRLLRFYEEREDSTIYSQPLSLSCPRTPQATGPALYDRISSMWSPYEEIDEFSALLCVPFMTDFKRDTPAEYGARCQGCQRDRQYGRKQEYAVSYTRKQLLEHYKNCRSAQDIASGKYYTVEQETEIRNKVEQNWCEQCGEGTPSYKWMHPAGTYLPTHWVVDLDYVKEVYFPDESEEWTRAEYDEWIVSMGNRIQRQAGLEL